jgi:hypothetical protein
MKTDGGGVAAAAAAAVPSELARGSGAHVQHGRHHEQRAHPGWALVQVGANQSGTGANVGREGDSGSTLGARVCHGD